jgi:hypothetical protein
MLSAVDLRPYLFVAKDRKDYFGQTSIVGHLANLADQLLGPKLLVQGLESDVKQLADAEAAQVFELIRARVIGSDVFDTQPPGVDGLAILAKTHPTLQNVLLDFLEALPVDRLGPWIVGGWDSVVTNPECTSRLQGLRSVWGKSSNRMLAVAANSTLKITKRTG